METPTCWSKLPIDLITSIFQQLSFLDIQRAKIVCSNWYLASKHRVIKKKGSPWLLLFPEKSNYVLYNPEVNDFYKPLIDYSRFRFLANSGKWFLVVTPQHNLCIIDLFSSERIDLPPLESLVLSDNHSLRRVGCGYNQFQFIPPKKEGIDPVVLTCKIDILRGLLWVDEKNKANYVVVWYFYSDENCCPYNIAFCKNGYDKYVDISIREREEEFIETLDNPRYMDIHLVLRGYKLYAYVVNRRVRILDDCYCLRILDLSGQNVVTQNKTSRLPTYGPSCCLTVTLSGEVLIVHSVCDRYWPIDSPKILKFKVYNYVSEVESLGSDDEALLIDLGVTTSVKDVPGIEPNSIYFSRHSLYRSQEYKVDICVFNLATKTLKNFPNLSDMSLKDARWFIPTLG